MQIYETLRKNPRKAGFFLNDNPHKITECHPEISLQPGYSMKRLPREHCFSLNWRKESFHSSMENYLAKVLPEDFFSLHFLKGLLYSPTTAKGNYSAPWAQYFF